eukprot:scaffold4748_cov113-Chaetoceros_neogracile.AAC.1
MITASGMRRGMPKMEKKTNGTRRGMKKTKRKTMHVNGKTTMKAVTTAMTMKAVTMNIPIRPSMIYGMKWDVR